MKPVFANSAWVSGPDVLLRRKGRWQRRGLRVRYGLFLHPDAGPVLIDTGYSFHSLTGPDRSFWLRSYGHLLAPKLNSDHALRPFLARFALRPEEVRKVIVTHFHVDHISGLADLPTARFLASQQGYQSIREASAFENTRHGIFPELLPMDFAQRLDAIETRARQPIAHLGAGYDLFGDGSVLAVALPGHAAGHFGLLFPQLARPLLYATDVQWVSEALAPENRPQLLPSLVSCDARAAAQSADAVWAFQCAGGHVMLCHDDATCAYDLAEGAQL